MKTLGTVETVRACLLSAKVAQTALSMHGMSDVHCMILVLGEIERSVADLRNEINKFAKTPEQILKATRQSP